MSPALHALHALHAGTLHSKCWPVPSAILPAYPSRAHEAVRTLFRGQKWFSTYWSLTQRPTGSWHANRLVWNIHKALRENHSHIFAEWHMDLDFSQVPDIERYVRAMRPDVHFVSFTILRRPELLVRSAYAYFNPSCPADLAIKLNPEMLLFQVLGVPRSQRQLNVSEVCMQQPELCERAAIQRASLRIAKHKSPHVAWNYTLAILERGALARLGKQLHELPNNAHDAGAGNRSASPPDAISAVERAVGQYQLANAASIQVEVSRTGCDVLVERALTVLSAVDHVLLLENPGTMRIMQATAFGHLSFQNPSDVDVSKFGHVFKQARTTRTYVAQYKAEAVIEDTLRLNRCSRQAYDRLAAGAHRRVSQDAPNMYEALAKHSMASSATTSWSSLSSSLLKPTGSAASFTALDSHL